MPDRLREGHGLSLAAIELAGGVGATVIVTVDCGTSSGDEVARAAERGIDVLITDHHRVPALLPPAVAIVNPQRGDSTYPHRLLAGSGVAFKLAQLLGDGTALDLADLATIGTVADLAPVIGENRAIARLGLERIRHDPRPGIAALLKQAGIDPARVDLETVAFVIAPRLNAAGRMGDARVALDLLLADDADTAERLAGGARHGEPRTAPADARCGGGCRGGDRGGGNRGSSGRHRGGRRRRRPRAVAGRHRRPRGVTPERTARATRGRRRSARGFVRGSCRAPVGFDLAASLEACSDLLTRHGGHAGAAGFEIAGRGVGRVRRAVPRPRRRAPGHPRPVLAVDLAIAAPTWTTRCTATWRLAPCGLGNPAPLVAVLGLTVTRVREATGGHAQLTLRRRIDVVDAIAFERADLLEWVPRGMSSTWSRAWPSRAFGGCESLPARGSRCRVGRARRPNATAVPASNVIEPDREPFLAGAPV